MSSIEHKYQLYDIKGNQYVLSSHLENIDSCMSFMNEILTGKDLYYRTTIKSNGQRQTKVSSLGEHLPHLHLYTYLYRPHYTYHPALMFFFEEYRKHEIRHCSGYGARDVIDSKGAITDIFDHFVSILRIRAVETKLKKKISDWESKTKKNKARTRELEDKLFSRHARLTVIRLDLDYRSASFTTEEIDQFQYKESVDKGKAIERYWNGADLSHQELYECRVAFEEVQRDRQRLFANMKGKPSLFEHLLGYVWRIECSPKAGYHLHVALFFNGAKVEHHEWLAQQIGQYWEECITQGRGRFHNCNRDWDKKSPHYGLGVINHYDQDKRANLRDKVLSYLCKGRQYVQVLPYAGCNLFGSGFAHRDHAKGRGRPRTKMVLGFNQPGPGDGATRI